MSKIYLKISICFTFLLLLSNAYAVDIDFAYIRAMGGISTENNLGTCFKLNGAASKYRMGNECEVYGELFFGQTLTGFSDGSALSAHVMPSLYKPLINDKLALDDRLDIRFAQAYASWDKIPALNNASIWAGRRYYKREDVHITDFFYWNPQGLGAGIENIELANNLKLSYAVFIDDNKDQAHNAARHDIQLRGIDVNPNGQLELGLSVIPRSHHTTVGDAGWAFTIQHRQNKILGEGNNKLALQYGVGPGVGLGGTGSLDNTDDVTRFRIVDGLYMQLTPKLGGMLTAVYQRDELQGGDQTWTSLGGRVSYGFSDKFKMQAELGNDWVSPSGQDTRRLTKLTIAPSWAFKGSAFFDRPELRFFYTYAIWNKAAATAAVGSQDAAVATLASNGVFGAADHGGTLGLQFEGWW
jgi:maltoporin